MRTSSEMSLEAFAGSAGCSGYRVFANSGRAPLATSPSGHGQQSRECHADRGQLSAA